MNNHYADLETALITFACSFKEKYLTVEIGRHFKYLDLTVVDGILNVIVLTLRYIIKLRNKR